MIKELKLYTNQVVKLKENGKVDIYENEEIIESDLNPLLIIKFYDDMISELIEDEIISVEEE